MHLKLTQLFLFSNNLCMIIKCIVLGSTFRSFGPLLYELVSKKYPSFTPSSPKINQNDFFWQVPQLQNYINLFLSIVFWVTLSSKTGGNFRLFHCVFGESGGKVPKIN